jgi:tRNA-2-methylthio-N6-dimethylallyladenosine synthase
MSERYFIRTFGCQMNEHDSERIAGLLEAQGMEPASDPDDADLVVLNTCAVRENADNKLYGALGHLATTKARRGLMIAVGGCLAQKDQGRVLERAPWVDVVFGTHNIGSLPVLLRRAREQGVAQAEFFDEMQAFPSALPARREAEWSAWVAISVGCNNTCTFCIVPKLRGKERSRRVGDVVAEVQALAASGVVEVTLLGQNVNSYGTDLPGHRQLFGDLLRGLDGVHGLDRLRFTSPNPKDFRDDVVDAMAGCRPLCEHVHFPLQSGSDRVLRLMRRGYRRRRYLEILGKLRSAIPGVAFSTDIIVGFPGETEEDFVQTLELVEAARFDSAFTFQYSPPGCPIKCPPRSSASASSGCSPSRSASASSATAPWSAPRSSCWSSRPAPRRTRPGCPAAPAPTSSATAPRRVRQRRPPRMPSRSSRATWSPWSWSAPRRIT